MNKNDVKEKVKTCIATAVSYCVDNDINLSRDRYRRIAKSLDLEYKSDWTARNLFGTWEDAVKAAMEISQSNMTRDDISMEFLDTPTEPREIYTVEKDKLDPTKIYDFLIVPDIHICHEDVAAINAVMKLSAHLKPDVVIQLGDLVDCASISRFSVSPTERMTLKRELDRSRSFLSTIKEQADASSAYMICGNHEDRLRKYLYAQAPALADIDAVSIPALLGLKDIGWNWIPFNEAYWISDQVMVVHGVKYGITASKQNAVTYGVSCIQGHSHRIQSHHITFKDRQIECHEIGSLCDPNAAGSYTDHCNWQQGCATVRVFNNKHWITVHPIKDGVLSYGDTLFDGNKDQIWGD